MNPPNRPALQPPRPMPRRRKPNVSLNSRHGKRRRSWKHKSQKRSTPFKLAVYWQKWTKSPAACPLMLPRQLFHRAPRPHQARTLEMHLLCDHTLESSILRASRRSQLQEHMMRQNQSWVPSTLSRENCLCQSSSPPHLRYRPIVLRRALSDLASLRAMKSFPASANST